MAFLIPPAPALLFVDTLWRPLEERDGADESMRLTRYTVSTQSELLGG